jgi:hypothetical protein
MPPSRTASATPRDETAAPRPPAAAPAAEAPPGEVLGLQRALGNQAVGRILRALAHPVSAAPADVIRRYPLTEDDIGRLFHVGGRVVRVLRLVGVHGERGTFAIPRGTLSIHRDRVLGPAEADAGPDLGGPDADEAPALATAPSRKRAPPEDYQELPESWDEEEDEKDEHAYGSSYDSEEEDEPYDEYFASLGTQSDFETGIEYLSDARGPEYWLDGAVDQYDWLARHRRMLAMGELRKTHVKQSGGRKKSKFTQNKVRASLTLVVRGPGGLRGVTVEIDRTFISGEGGTTAAVKAWLARAGIIESEDDYQAERHAHSEEDLIVHLNDPGTRDALLQALAAGVGDGEEAVAVILDVASYPNTVCGECHRSLDAAMTLELLPRAREILGAPEMMGIINASGANHFAGSGPRAEDQARWVESAVRFDDIANAEKRARTTGGRGSRAERGRGQGRAERDEVVVVVPAPDDLHARVAAEHGPVIPVAGDGNACYVRAILTGLAHDGIIEAGEVEGLVAAITGHLVAVGIRMDGQMIDAGGLVAAEVRRVIAQLTDHVMDGGIDVGITVVQWDVVNGGLTEFQANQGTYPVTLLYTPGHFDVITE